MHNVLALTMPPAAQLTCYYKNHTHAICYQRPTPTYCQNPTLSLRPASILVSARIGSLIFIRTVSMSARVLGSFANGVSGVVTALVLADVPPMAEASAALLASPVGCRFPGLITRAGIAATPSAATGASSGDAVDSISASASRTDESQDGQRKRNEEDEDGQYLELEAVPALRTPSAALRAVIQIARENIFAALAADGGQGHWAGPSSVIG